MQKFGYLKCLDSSPSCKDLKKASDHLKFMLQLKHPARCIKQKEQGVLQLMAPTEPQSLHHWYVDYIYRTNTIKWNNGCMHVKMLNTCIV